MGKFKVAIDCDNVCNNLMVKLIELYNKRYNAQFKLEDFTEYDFFKCLPYDTAENLINLLFEKSLWDSLSPMHHAQNGIKNFVDQGYEVYFVTASNPETFQWQVDFLQKYFSTIPKKNIIYTHHKGMLNVDVLVDDSIDNLLNGHYDRVCMDAPWNRNVRDEVYGIYRALNWPEIVNAVNKIYKLNKE